MIYTVGFRVGSSPLSTLATGRRRSSGGRTVASWSSALEFKEIFAEKHFQ